MKTSPKPKAITTHGNFVDKPTDQSKKEKRETNHVFNDTWEKYFVGQMVFDFFHKVRSLPFNYFKKVKEAIKRRIRKIKAKLIPTQLTLSYGA
jgi:hypothetical protein